MNNTSRHAKELIHRCIDFRDAKEKERTLRDEFFSHLRRIFPDPEDQKWIDHYTRGAESTQKLRQKRKAKTVRRFVDTLINATVIEYEKDTRDSHLYEHGKSQLREYVAGEIQKGIPYEQVRAILSDFVQWEVFEIQVKTSVDAQIADADDIELISIEQFDAEDYDPVTPERYLQFLKKHLGRREARQLNADKLVLDFGLKSRLYIEHAGKLNTVVLKARRTDGTVKLATSLWARFVDHLESGSGHFRSSNYSAQLYLMIFARLLSANVLNKKALSSTQNELEEILSGEYFYSEFKLLNFVEPDYFGWSTHFPHIHNIIGIAHAMQMDLAAYNYADPPKGDVFAPLVGQLASKTKRKLLGQEQTPREIARLLAKTALEAVPASESPRLVDMCCGSGVIICEVLIEMIERNTKVTAEYLMNSITGFDIDPLAVALAKTNWVITLAHKIVLSKASLTIPIFHADSLFVVSPTAKALPIPKDAVDVPIHLGGKRIQLPRILIEPEFRLVFDQLIDWAYDSAIKAQKTKTVNHINLSNSIALLKALCRKHGVTLPANDFSRSAKSIHELTKLMANLALTGRNGIWAFILKNTYRPSLLAGSFNGIVSNPPWLALSQITNNPYKDRIRSRTGHYGLLPGGASFLHLDIATTFLLFATDRYLSKNGSFSVLLPGTILEGTHHQPLRDRKFLNAKRSVPLSFHQIIKAPKETFKVMGVILHGHKYDTVENVPQKSISAFFWTGQDLLPSDFKEHILGKERTAWVVGKGTTGQQVESTSLIIPDQGADLMPRTAICIEIKDRMGNEWSVATPKQGSPSFHVIGGAKEMTKARFSGRVASQYIHEMLQSLNLLPFWLNDNLPSIAIPAYRNKRNKIIIVEDDDLKASGLRNSSRYFNKIDREMARAGISQKLRDKIDTRRKLSLQNFSQKGYLILQPAGGSDPCAAVFKLHKKQSSTFVDQTLYWKWVPTQGEAYFYAGIINSLPLARKINDFNPKGRFGRRHVHTLPWRVMPLFSPKNKTHKRIAKLSRDLEILVVNAAVKDIKLRSLKSALHSRRKRARKVIEAFPECRELNRLSALII